MFAGPAEVRSASRRTPDVEKLLLVTVLLRDEMYERALLDRLCALQLEHIHEYVFGLS